MQIFWSDEALNDLEEILTYYYLEANPRTAVAVEQRIIEAIESLPPFSERIRESDRVPSTRELVVHKLPYVVFLQVLENRIIVLNIVHTKRKSPA